MGGAEQNLQLGIGRTQLRIWFCCTLSVDHRSVDGAVGAEYLKAFKEIITKPVALMMG